MVVVPNSQDATEDATEAQHRFMLESMADAVIATDLELKITSWLGAAEAIYGWTAAEAMGRLVPELLATQMDESHEDSFQRLQRDGVWRGEARQRCKDGSWVTIRGQVTIIHDALGQPTGVLAVNSDITALKELQAQYAQAQKMEALGSLTAGIAHDFGNLLMSISGCAALALSKVDAGGDAARHLRTLLDAVKRGASLSRQLMNFTRRGEPTTTGERVDLDALVMSTRVLLERLVGDHIELKTELCCPDSGLRAAASQLEQVLVNLIINAADAMPTGGSVTIRTQRVEVSEHDAKRRGLPAGGDYAQLTVRDTGHGMDEATRTRIFEPFFTTKAVGKGTGLGLSTVYAFMRELGGGIEVHSEVGRGTCFALYLPWSTASDAAAAEPPQALPRGTETVLLVEDESLVRLTVRHYLESLGYTVLEASGPLDALDVCKAYPGPIGLLLSDVVMPEMSGPEAVVRARALRPDIRVLLMSAHAQDHLLAQGRLQAGDDVLHKPFTRAELAHAVRVTLDAAPAPAELPRQLTGEFRLLLVDDSTIAVKTLGLLLEEFDYRVTAASTAHGALAEFGRAPAAFDLVVTDYMLPDMTGRQLADQLRRERPALPVVYMSGHRREDVDDPPDAPWLVKPVEIDALVDVIEAVLSSGASRPAARATWR